MINRFRKTHCAKYPFNMSDELTLLHTHTANDVKMAGSCKNTDYRHMYCKHKQETGHTSFNQRKYACTHMKEDPEESN